jgi:hypothetical protein
MSTVITIKEAAQKLGVAEEIVRFSLEDAYPDTFDSLEEISLAEFEVVAQSMKAKATGEDVKVIEGSALYEANAPTNAPTTAPNASPSALTTQQQQAIVTGTVNALNEFAGSYTLSLDQLVQALAFTTAQKSVDNFVEIHSTVLSTGLEGYLEQVATEFTTAAHIVTNTKASDFLASKGIKPTRRTADKAVQEILSLSPNS